MKAQTKRIGEGFYEGKYNGITYTITKVIDYNNEINWYFQIGNSPAEDWFTKKSTAIKAAKMWIDSNVNKNVNIF